jgi:UDP-N-acetylmuramate: L-alanyl-gamma-D-glutamyl-meso-diaminopimelate ligase
MATSRGISNDDLKTQNKWVHFVAVGGTGMGALAALLKDSGYFVTGSDGVLYPPMSVFLDKKKILRKESFSESNLRGETWGLTQGLNPELVIVGNAVSRSHVEAKVVEELLNQGKTQRMSFAQGLAEFAIRDRRSFVVCGTHGKTTTTSLLAWAFEASKKSPGFFIGGIPKNFGKGCEMGTGQCFVSEGDEYDTAYWDKKSKFLHYRPHWVLCTGIEFDHVDIFSSVEKIEDSFCELVDKTQQGWVLVDDLSAPRKESVQRIARKVLSKGIPLLRYGRDESSQYRLLEISPVSLPWRPEIRGIKIKIKTPKGVMDLVTPLSGEYNALNLLGVVAICLESEELVTQEQIQNFLNTFDGVKRRQDEVFSDSGLVVVDDFAHHPTAIRETLRGMRFKYPGLKIAAFFEARSATSSRNVFEKEFSECFDEADAVFLSPPTKANIPENEKLNIENVVKTIQQRKGPDFIYSHKDVEGLLGYFQNWAKIRVPPNQKILALVMSNGPFQDIFSKIKREK